MSSLSELAPDARAKMDKYTDPAGHYAFHTYDLAPLTQGDHLRAEDILAANLLSLRLTWRHVTPMFAEGDDLPQRLLASLDAALVPLRAAEPFETYETEKAMHAALEPVAAANRATTGVDGWTQVTVSKVLHRHAPHVVPLVDSRVRAFYRARAGNERELRHRMWKDIQANLDWLAPLAGSKHTPDGRDLSVLRLVDILIWTPSP